MYQLPQVRFLTGSLLFLSFLLSGPSLYAAQRVLFGSPTLTSLDHRLFVDVQAPEALNQFLKSQLPRLIDDTATALAHGLYHNKVRVYFSDQAPELLGDLQKYPSLKHGKYTLDDQEQLRLMVYETNPAHPGTSYLFNHAGLMMMKPMDASTMKHILTLAKQQDAQAGPQYLKQQLFYALEAGDTPLVIDGGKFKITHAPLPQVQLTLHDTGHFSVLPSATQPQETLMKLHTDFRDLYSAIQSVQTKKKAPTFYTIASAWKDRPFEQKNGRPELLSLPLADPKRPALQSAAMRDHLFQIKEPPAAHAARVAQHQRIRLLDYDFEIDQIQKDLAHFGFEMHPTQQHHFQAILQ